MKVVIVIFAVIAFIICLYLGLHMGGLTGPTTTVTPEVTYMPTTGSDQQHTIVLIQADDLSSSSPHLVGIWLAFYYVDYPKLTMLLLYPPMAGNTQDKSVRLGQLFSLTPDGELAPGFSTALQSFGFNSNGYIITDNYTLIKWIDWLKGINFGDKHAQLDGSGVIAKLAAVDHNNQDIGSWMEQVTDGVCGKLNQLSGKADWNALAGTIEPVHLHTDLNYDWLMEDWKALKNNDEGITCELVVPR